MTNLSGLFKSHFNITDVIDLKFVDINDQINVVWRGNLVPLTYGKNRRFYSKNSLLKEHGIGLAWALKLEQEVHLPTKNLTEFISAFKAYHNITGEINLPFYQENSTL